MVEMMAGQLDAKSAVTTVDLMVAKMAHPMGRLRVDLMVAHWAETKVVKMVETKAQMKGVPLVYLTVGLTVGL